MTIAIRLCFLILIYVGALDGQIQLYNDEFEDPSTSVNWMNINQVESWDITQLENYNFNDSVLQFMD